VREEGLQDVEIGDLCATEGRELEPEGEDSLEGEVPREVVEDDTESEALDEVEATEYDPVCEPLDIILRLGRFESLEGKVSRETPADEIRNGCGERVEEMEEGDQKEQANDGVGLGHLSALFEVVKDWVLGELLVKLVDVVVGGVRRLNKGGVLLDLLRGRHG